MSRSKKRELGCRSGARDTARSVGLGWLLGLLVILLAAPSAQAQPVNGLLVHFEFEGNVLDSSGNMHDGTSTGTLSYAPGVLGMAASFSGDDAITVGSFPHAALSTADFSVTFWFDTPTDRQASFVGKRTTCAISPFLDIRSQIGTMNFAISGSAENYVVFAPRTSGWRSYAAVRAGGFLRLYIDGELRGLTAIPALDIENSAPLGISTSPCIGVDGTQTLLGELDDLRIYDRSLSTTEVASFVPGLIFRDGFESGGLTAWSSFTP